jgi:small GTP-binding protein
MTVHESTFKIVTVGETEVGKTSIVNRFSNQTMPTEPSPTIGAFSHTCVVHVDKTTSVILNVWDTAGQERFQAMIPLYLRNARAVLVVVDLTRPPNFPALIHSIESLKSSIDPDAPIFLCGNETDLLKSDEVIRYYEEWALTKHIPFCATSAVTGEGISQLFKSVAQALVANKVERDVTEEGPNLVNRDESSKCC